MAAAAAGIAGGAAVGAGGGIGGSIIAANEASQSSGDQINTFLDPANNLALQASEFDALNLIGFGNIGNVPGPLEQLIARINVLPISNKAKRRALRAIADIRAAGVTNINDPAFARQTDSGFGNSGFVPTISQDVRRAGRLRAVLKRLGLTDEEFSGILQEDIQFKIREANLQEELGTRNETTIRNRARTAETASQLLADSAGFASSGLPQSGLQSDFLNRINRGIDDQENQLLIRAQFGGFQPGAGLEGLNRQRTDAALTALEQSLAAAAGLTAGLGGGLDFAQRAAQISTGANVSAAGIAADQAIAANSIRGDTGAFGQGIADASAALGTGISTGIIAAGQNRSNTTPVTFGPSVSNPEFNTGFGNIRLTTQIG